MHEHGDGKYNYYKYLRLFVISCTYISSRGTKKSQFQSSLEEKPVTRELRSWLFRTARRYLFYSDMYFSGQQNIINNV